MAEMFSVALMVPAQEEAEPEPRSDEQGAELVERDVFDFGPSATLVFVMPIAPQPKVKTLKRGRCEVESCVMVGMHRGFCFKHANERGIPTNRECKVEGCKTFSHRGGFCAKHQRCKAPGCEKAKASGMASKGFCSKHGGGGTRDKHERCEARAASKRTLHTTDTRKAA